MKITIEKVGGGPDTLEGFADKNGLVMEVRERSGVRGYGKYYASFRGVDVSEGDTLIGKYGNGDTPEVAISNYAFEIAGKRIKVGYPEPKPYRYIQCPNEWLPSK